jgi:hypothetical protein
VLAIPATTRSTFGCPSDLAAGRWELVIEANGVRSVPIPIEISVVSDFLLGGMSPTRPHPSQLVRVSTRPFNQVVEYVRLTDSQGRQWQLRTGGSSDGVGFRLPDDIADGEASVQAGRTEYGVERLSEPLRFSITSGPLPLSAAAAGVMRPVAAAQWTDLGKDHLIEYEIARADRIEVQFRQGDLAIANPAAGPDKVHVQVPGRLKPGEVEVRSRTWIEQTASEWSEPASFQVLEQPVPPSVAVIEAGLIRRPVWYSGEPGAVIQAPRGEALVLRGHFPVRNARDLRVQLRGSRRTLELQGTDVDGGVRVLIPPQAASGDWRIVVAARSGNTPPQEIATVRVTGAADAPAR